MNKIINYLKGLLAELGYIKNSNKIKELLREIDKYYCVKFRTLHRLTFNNFESTKCSVDTKRININLCDNLNSNHFNSLFHFKSDIQKCIYALLHEFYHSMDRNKDIESFDYKNNRSYHMDAKYHDSLPFEKRANSFAKKEIKKWR